MKTATGLVKHAQRALQEKVWYLYGTFWQKLTPSLLEYKVGQYPKQIIPHYEYIKENKMGSSVTDCVGLMKSYLWWEESTQQPIYDALTDYSANMAFSHAPKRGQLELNGIPEAPGLCVWRSGHIGVYEGKGQVIEAKGHRYGVVRTPLKGVGSNSWTHWLQYPGIDYSPQEVPMPKVDLSEVLSASLSHPAEWQTRLKVLQEFGAVCHANGLQDFAILRYLDQVVLKAYEAGYKAGGKLKV